MIQTKNKDFYVEIRNDNAESKLYKNAHQQRNLSFTSRLVVRLDPTLFYMTIIIKPIKLPILTGILNLKQDWTEKIIPFIPKFPISNWFPRWTCTVLKLLEVSQF
jgi:hypothetical protein